MIQVTEMPKEGHFVATTPGASRPFSHTYEWQEGKLCVYHKVITYQLGGWYVVDESTQFTSETMFFVQGDNKA